MGLRRRRWRCQRQRAIVPGSAHGRRQAHAREGKLACGSRGVPLAVAVEHGPERGKAQGGCKDPEE